MSLGRCLLGVSLSMVLLLSACIGPGSDEWREEVQEKFSEPAKQVVVETRSFDGEAQAPDFRVGQSRISPEWSFMVEPGSSNLELEFQWGSMINDYTFVLEQPDGVEEQELESSFLDGFPGETFSWKMNRSDAPVGVYKAYVASEGLILEDDFTLDVRWEMLVGVSGTQAEEIKELSAVSFEREGDGWRATLPYRSTGPVQDPLTLDVDTFNGRIEVKPTTGDEATAWIHAWSVAESQERAEELARSLQVSLMVGDDRLKAHAQRGSDTNTGNTESVGAAIYLEVPVAVDGSVKTSNGRIELEDLTVSDLDVKTSNGRITATGLETRGTLVLDTSNGRITAELRGSGDIELDTSNGQITFDLDPTGDTRLNVGSSNGQLELNLKESSSIGYRLDARTGNGKIAQRMSEASLDGEGREATLVTNGFDDRSTQVTGNVRTSNGGIGFVGT